MRKSILFLAMGVCFISFSTAIADEIVHFANGTFLRVQRHEIKGEMVHVFLDANATMAFPVRLIDKIESGQSVVFGAPQSQTQVNQVIARTPSPPPANPNDPYSTPVVGNPAFAVRNDDGQSKGSDRMTAPVYGGPRMLSGSGAEKSFPDSSIMAGRARGPAGSLLSGDKVVLPGKSSFRSPVPLTQRPGVTKPEPEPSGDSSGGSKEGSGGPGGPGE